MSEEIKQPVLEMVLPLPHILSRMVCANETYFLASRGSFKTTRGISLYVIDKVFEMPKSSGVIVGLSFEHLGDNTLPPLLHSWEGFGIKAGEHYVYGQKPPKHWEKPFLSVNNDKYDHTISFYNGTVIHLVSLKKKASANGISAQWGVFDEAKFMQERMLVDEIFPIFRGNENHFKNHAGYLSKFFATDKLADPAKIKWLLNKKKLNDPVRINVIITLQQELTRLKELYNEAGINKKDRLKPKLAAIESRLNKLRSNMVYYLEASALDVVPILGEKWLKDKQRNMRAHEFNIAILNKNPDKPGVSFYPDLDTAKHIYESDFDINPVKPFIIASDYQHSITPICVAQLCKLPGEENVSLNFVDEVYTLAPEGLADAVQKFCDKYKSHSNKLVHYIYDHTAVGRRVDADKYFEIVVKVLKLNRWKVVEHYTGQAPLHYQKYEDLKSYFKETNPLNPAIRINARCEFTIISMTGAAASTNGGKTEKDKKNEKDLNLDQRETTHFSDVADMIVHGVITQKVVTTTITSTKAQTR